MEKSRKTGPVDFLATYTYRIVPNLRPPPNYRPPLFFSVDTEKNIALFLCFLVEILRKNFQFMESSLNLF